MVLGVLRSEVGEPRLRLALARPITFTAFAFAAFAVTGPLLPRAISFAWSIGPFARTISLPRTISPFAGAISLTPHVAAAFPAEFADLVAEGSDFTLQLEDDLEQGRLALGLRAELRLAALSTGAAFALAAAFAFTSALDTRPITLPSSLHAGPGPVPFSRAIALTTFPFLCERDTTDHDQRGRQTALPSTHGNAPLENTGGIGRHPNGPARLLQNP